jgi:RNA polymerase subunit RPABC4/transcription elongation factor Spt4
VSALARALHSARAELACERCQNRGWVTIRNERDECPECHGTKRNEATIALLELLVVNADDSLEAAIARAHKEGRLPK